MEAVTSDMAETCGVEQKRGGGKGREEEEALTAAQAMPGEEQRAHDAMR